MPWRLIVAGVVGIFALIGMLTDEGPPSMSTIEVGDCFSSASFELGTAADCSQLHSVQVFAMVDVDPNSSLGVNACFDRSQRLNEDGNIPAGTVVPERVFVGAVGGSGSNANQTFCYLESPSGDLVGSLVPE